MQLTILPFEDVNLSDCQRISEKLRIFFPYIITAPKVSIPQHAYDLFRNQYDANALLQTVERNRDGIVLGITGKDIFSETLNFVFGLAKFSGKSALISLNRLHEGTNVDCYYNRAFKEALHEIGHCLGLSHCDEPLCIMHFSNSLADVDNKSSLYCDHCVPKLPEDIRKLWQESHSSKD